MNNNITKKQRKEIDDAKCEKYRELINKYMQCGRIQHTLKNSHQSNMCKKFVNAMRMFLDCFDESCEAYIHLDHKTENPIRMDVSSNGVKFFSTWFKNFKPTGYWEFSQYFDNKAPGYYHSHCISSPDKWNNIISF